jgi:predicted membrane protein
MPDQAHEDSDPKKIGTDFEERLRQRIHDRINDRLDRSFRRRRSGRGGLVLGLILAGIGVLLLLQNLGVLYIDDLWEYWPVILILLGVSRAATACSWGSRIWGGAVAFAGVIFLLGNLGIIHGNVWNFFWPAILICVGLGMLARGAERQGYWDRAGLAIGASGDSRNSFNEWAVFGGGRRQITTQDFEGGEANALFGGIRIDLRQAATKKPEIVIDANAMFGGIDIRVPEAWDVTVRGAGIFGGYESRTEDRPMDSKRPHLIITGYALFGGVNVKN